MSLHHIIDVDIYVLLPRRPGRAAYNTVLATHQIDRTVPHQLKSLPPVSPLQQSGSDGLCTCKCRLENSIGIYIEVTTGK